MKQEKPGPHYTVGVDVSTLPDGTDQTVVAVLDTVTKCFVACGDAILVTTRTSPNTEPPQNEAL